MTWLIAALSVRTSISPNELLATPPRILACMIEQVFPSGDIKRGNEAWQGLASMVSG